MKKLFLLTLALIITASCSDLSSYRYRQTYAMTQPVLAYNRVHEDNEILWRFEIGDKKIETNITNKSDKDITLLWSKVRFIDSHGAEYHIANRETIFTRGNRKMADGKVSPTKTEKNILVPINRIKKLEEQWTWRIIPMFDLTSDKAELNRRKTFSIVFPVVVLDGEKRSYKFDFMVASVIPEKVFTPR